MTVPIGTPVRLQAVGLPDALDRAQADVNIRPALPDLRGAS